MFTIQQIKEAHSKVKSGADFSKYIQDLIAHGVTSYETFVSEGHTLYHANNFNASSEMSQLTLNVSDRCNIEQFKSDLKAHQQGKTDYPTFRNDCAKSGIEKWIVIMDKKTCTYYDRSGNEVLTEDIPV